MFKDKLNYKLVNFLLLLIICYIGISTIDWWSGIINKFISILFPFVVAFSIAYALYPLVKKIENKGVRKNLAITLVVTLMSSLIAGVFLITIPLVYDQLITLSKLLGEVITDFSLRFSLDSGSFEEGIISVLNDAISNVGKYVSTGTLQLVGKSVSFITKFIIIYIVSIYFLAGMGKIRENIKFLLRKRRDRSFVFVKAIDKDLGQYLHGLVIFMIIQLFEYCFLFWIVGHPNWLLLGVLASITTIIPYFGGLVTNIVAVVLASVVSTPVFIATLIICIVAPNIDGYIISPKVYGKTNNISALWTIFSVFVGGTLFGVVGIIISLPLYIVINRAYHFFKEDIIDKIDDIKEQKKRSY